MNSLQLRHQLDSGTPTLRPVIDGADMLAGHRNDQGLHPECLLPLSSQLLPTADGHRVLIGCCSCGETGCGSLALRVRRLGGEVHWEPDEHTQDETLSSDCRFDPVPYLDAVDRASQDRPGEGRGSRVARAVRVLLSLHDQTYEALTPFQSAGVDWIGAWPWESETVKASVIVAGEQRIEEFHAVPRESDDAFAARVAARIDDLRFGRSE